MVYIKSLYDVYEKPCCVNTATFEVSRHMADIFSTIFLHTNRLMRIVSLSNLYHGQFHAQFATDYCTVFTEVKKYLTIAEI